ncbi:hypothetical protein PVK06_020794 [Gossypium arboreum]|uniref:Pentatricopeptide repeat-containing protein n=1 Tax=Gossypium arboreum TaxID=29729 RepID=A0ABR0PNN7_GOSAR|nr:hypothetical protein PVK06_020794 [Gossypium arboreum]
MWLIWGLGFPHNRVWWAHERVRPSHYRVFPTLYFSDFVQRVTRPVHTAVSLLTQASASVTKLCANLHMGVWIPTWPGLLHTAGAHGRMALTRQILNLSQFDCNGKSMCSYFQLSLTEGNHDSELGWICAILVIDCANNLYSFWTLLLGLARGGFESDRYVVNSLIDGYGKCALLEDATRIFRECLIVDLEGFTSIITTYSQSGQGEETLKLYLEMLDKGIEPDPYVCSSLLNACANLSIYEQGKQVHVHVLKHGFMYDIFEGNSLINMYAKCGSINDVECAFSSIPETEIVSWSAMIGGLAQHRHGKKALWVFNQMLKYGVSPNQITLVIVLYACNHAGLVTEAQKYCRSMNELFGFEPMQEHYACMIDLLG